MATAPASRDGSADGMPDRSPVTEGEAGSPAVTSAPVASRARPILFGEVRQQPPGEPDGEARSAGVGRPSIERRGQQDQRPRPPGRYRPRPRAAPGRAGSGGRAPRQPFSVPSRAASASARSGGADRRRVEPSMLARSGSATRPSIGFAVSGNSSTSSARSPRAAAAARRASRGGGALTRLPSCREGSRASSSSVTPCLVAILVAEARPRVARPFHLLQVVLRQGALVGQGRPPLLLDHVARPPSSPAPEARPSGSVRIAFRGGFRARTSTPVPRFSHRLSAVFVTRSASFTAALDTARGRGAIAMVGIPS